MQVYAASPSARLHPDGRPYQPNSLSKLDSSGNRSKSAGARASSTSPALAAAARHSAARVKHRTSQERTRLREQSLADAAPLARWPMRAPERPMHGRYIYG